MRYFICKYNNVSLLIFCEKSGEAAAVKFYSMFINFILHAELFAGKLSNLGRIT